jgi:hypothetical protein
MTTRRSVDGLARRPIGGSYDAMQHLLRAALLAALLGALGCQREPTWTPVSGYPAANGYGATNWPFEERETGVIARDVVTASTSDAIADVFGFLLYGVMFSAAAFWVWSHRRRALMELGSDPRAPLVDGPAVVVGTVEPPPGWNGPVVRIDIHQVGNEWQHKGAWHHAWKEQRRDVNVRPFTIVRDDGVRVQVEPDARVAVHDSHNDIQRHNHTQRTRICDIKPGERVHVSGVVVGAQSAQGHGGAYRQGYGAPTVRAPAVGRMVISAEAPGATSLARMRFHRNWAIALAAVFTFLCAVVMPEYLVLSATGQTEWATPTATDYWRTWHKPKNSSGYWVYHHAIQGTVTRDGETLSVSDETGDGPSRCVESRQCLQVPFVVSSIAPSYHQFGLDPHLTTGRVVLLVLFGLVLLIAYPASVVSSRPWYLHSKVNDTGSGPLAASQP